MNFRCRTPPNTANTSPAAHRDAETKAEMKKVLAEFSPAKFTRDWMLENKVNQTSFKATRARLASIRSSRLAPSSAR